MRPFAYVAPVLVAVASALASAIALAQGATWGGAAPLPSPSSSVDAPDARPPEAAAVLDAAVPDAGAPAVLPAAPSASTSSPDDAGASNPDGGEPGLVGFSIGVRGGVSIPAGQAGDVPLSQIVQLAVPIGVEAGWFFSPHFYLGGYFFYGFGIGSQSQNDACNVDANSSCSSTLYRAGVTADWHFSPLALMEPWMGAGLGFSALTSTVSDSSATDASNLASGALRGFDLTLQGGLDWKPLRYLGLGPYAELAAGPYWTESGRAAFHTWISLGARFRTNL